MDACECERDNGSNMLQALHFINGKSILEPRAEPGRAGRRCCWQKKPTDDELVTELYLWSLARHPTDKEREAGPRLPERRTATSKPAAAQDLMWALLNSRDFLLSH